MPFTVMLMSSGLVLSSIGSNMDYSYDGGHRMMCGHTTYGRDFFGKSVCDRKSCADNPLRYCEGTPLAVAKKAVPAEPSGLTFLEVATNAIEALNARF